MNLNKRQLITGLYILFLAGVAAAQTQTVGLFVNTPDSFEGYTMLPPANNEMTYLIDNNGLVVNSWSSDYQPGQSAYLLESGNLLRTCMLMNPSFTAGGSAGRFEVRDWDDNITWEYDCSSTTFQSHHDAEGLPGGNVLLIVWEYKSALEAVDAGRNPALLNENALWPDKIIEVQQTGPGSGEIVWEWHVWDHLIQDYDPGKPNYGVVADHPELIDLNYVFGIGPNAGGADWNHTNAVDYNADLDQIVLSVHNFHEVWIIDHSTTTEEAAGHTGGNCGKGGDLLYRWGNPATYDRGSTSDRKLFGQHDARWILEGCPGAGDLMVFNNGQGRPGGNYSSVDQWTPPLEPDRNYTLNFGEAYGPAELSWSYQASDSLDFFAQNVSGASRMENGNTLICEGPIGRLFEVTNSGEMVWEYINPVTLDGPMYQYNTIPGGPQGLQNRVFKVERYAADYPGLIGHDLSPGNPIEMYVDPVSVILTPDQQPITIPATGGTFDYNIAVSNDEITMFNLDVWVMVTLPNGLEYGPVIGPVDVAFPVGFALNRDRVQAVPGNAPEGNYSYDSYVGISPDAIWAEDHFAFEKLADGQTGLPFSEWNWWENEPDQQPDVSSPVEFVTLYAYPNPFNPIASIRFQLAAASRVNLSVYNIEGAMVAIMIDDWLEAGSHEVSFDGSDFASGVYIYTLKVFGSKNASDTATLTTKTGRMLLLK